MEFREPQGDTFALALNHAAAGDYDAVRTVLGRPGIDFKDPRCLASYFELLRHLDADDGNRITLLIDIGNWFLDAGWPATALKYYREAMDLDIPFNYSQDREALLTRQANDSYGSGMHGHAAVMMTALIGNSGRAYYRYLRAHDLFCIDGFTTDSVSNDQLEIIVSDMDRCPFDSAEWDDRYDLHLMACAALHRLGRTEEALVRADAALLDERSQERGQDDALPRLMSMRAELLLALGRPEKAVEACDEATEVYTARGETDEHTQLTRTRALIQLGRFGEAEAGLDRLAAMRDWKWLHQEIGSLRTALADARTAAADEMTEKAGHHCTELLAFYGEDDGPNGSGYTREAILDWPDVDWEEQHDFIQWLFPTDQSSMFNPDAPVLDASTIAAFRADPLMRQRLRQSFDRWLAFCGVARTESGLAFHRANPAVWKRQNHNWMRISRVLRSLNLLGLRDDAQALFALLTTIRESIDPTTWGHWQANHASERPN